MLQIPERKQLTVPKIESPEGYYEEAEPYDTSVNGMSQGLGPEGSNCYNPRAGADSSFGDRQAHLGLLAEADKVTPHRKWPRLRTGQTTLSLWSV